MKSILFNIVGFATLCVALYSCSEFIEKDLSDNKVFLTSPSDSLETNKYNQTFWWEPIDNASYRLQIASPSFDSIAELVLDTLVKSNKFIYTLEPGEYEWRVRAENSTSQGIYTSRKLTIHLSSIATQKIQLKSPGTGFITNRKDITYSWHGLFGTNVYRLQIDTNNFSDENALVFNSTTPNLEFTVPLTVDKLYQWRVRAENDTDLSKWSPIQTLTLDATPPAKVILSSPSTSQVVSKPVMLQWSSVAGAVKYQLIIYKSDGVTIYNSTFPINLSATNYSFNEGDFNETIYWKVRAIDAAGNIGAYSDVRSFTVQ